MKVYRKAATADWGSENVKAFEELKLPTKPWEGSLTVTFDATKDDKAERRTVVRLSISESEVEAIYKALQAARQSETKALRKNAKKLAKLFLLKCPIQTLSDDEQDLVFSVM